MEKKISISQIKEVAQEAYNEVKGSTGGKNADYIPYLANIDSKLFGLSICLMNGQTINIGDTDYRFGIESVSKVHTAILILRQYGAHTSNTEKARRKSDELFPPLMKPLWLREAIQHSRWSEDEHAQSGDSPCCGGCSS